MLLSDAIEQTDCVKLSDIALTDEDLDEIENCRAWKEIVRCYGQRITQINALLDGHIGVPDHILHCLLTERRLAREAIDLPRRLRANKAAQTPKREQAEKKITQLMEETRDA